MPSGWLYILEPGDTPGSPTDQTNRMDGSSGQKGSFTQTMLQRGGADIPLRVYSGDTYAPTVGCEVFLYDQIYGGGTVLAFVGTIDRIELTWDGVAGDRLYHLTCVSLEQCFDVIRVPPGGYVGQTCGFIVTDLFNNLMAGAPVTLGTISAGAVIPSISFQDWPRFSDIIGQLATASNFIWGVDPGTQTLYFDLPSTTAAPFTLATSQMQWESMKWDQNRQDYRNRQIVQISPAAFAQSSELFPCNGSQIYFQLKRSPQEVTFAWITQNTQSHATGAFSGVPNPSDTITVSYPGAGSIYNWAALSVYVTGQSVIDPSGHVQTCTVGGTSGASMPSWDDSGGTTSDGSVVWQDQGIPGGGIYTWVATLDNTQWGQILIGANATQCALNFVAAINSDQTLAGTKFSWPTWENPLLNATATGGGGISVVNKPAGAGYSAGLAESCTNFSWSAGSTSGGSTSGTTTVLQIAQNGQSSTANLYWTPGDTQVAIASVPSGGGSYPPASGHSLQVQYTRLGGDCIVVEDSAAVAARAIIENGTGKYQQLISDTTITSNATGLLSAQQALAAYLPIPISFIFDTLVAGLTAGQYLHINVSDLPVGIAALVNGFYAVQEVHGELVVTGGMAAMPVGGTGGGGHYRYTVTVINVAQIGSWLQFWQGLVGGGGGGNAAIAGSGGSGGSAGNTVVLAETLTGPTNITTTAPSAGPDGSSWLVVQLTQDATGGRTITWDTPTIFSPGPPTNINFGANALSMFVFVSIGGKWRLTGTWL